MLRSIPGFNRSRSGTPDDDNARLSGVSAGAPLRGSPSSLRAVTTVVGVCVLTILAVPVLWAFGVSRLLYRLRERRRQHQSSVSRLSVADIARRVEAERFVRDVRDGQARWPVAGYTPSAYHARDADIAWQPLPTRQPPGRHAAADGRQSQDIHWPVHDHDCELRTDMPVTNPQRPIDVNLDAQDPDGRQHDR